MANEIKLNLKNSAQMKLALSALSNNDIQRVASAIAEVLQPEFDAKADKTALEGTNERISAIATELYDADNALERKIQALDDLHNADAMNAEVRAVAIESKIGNIDNLQTENKSNLVAAINELVGDMGYISTSLSGKAEISYVDSAISTAIGEVLESDY